MHETTEQAAARAASLMRQGAAIVTWATDPRFTAVGVIWADRGTELLELLPVGALGELAHDADAHEAYERLTGRECPACTRWATP